MDALIARSGEPEASAGKLRWVGGLGGTPGIVVAFLWGVTEGTVFFVVPDVALSLVALLQPRRAWRHLLAAVAGSVVAGTIMFGWAVRDARGAHAMVAGVPFVTEKMFAKVHASYEAHGLGAVFLGPVSGIPYKIYAVEGPEFLGEAEFLLGTAPARAERFVIVWGGFGLAGILIRRFTRWTAGRLAMAHGLFWVIFYALYWGAILLR